MPDSIGQETQELHPHAFAVKRWLRMACDRLGLYPKAIYMPLGIDAGTWSRWTSYEHEQTVPMAYLPGVLSLLDKQAKHDLDDLLEPKRTASGRNQVVTLEPKKRAR